jgi:hypothetical protein
MLPVVLYGRETWSLASIDCAVNRVLRGMFEPKRDEVPGGWRIWHEDLHNLFSSPSKIKIIKLMKIRWAGHLERMERRGIHILNGVN